ncbi:peptidoglycan-binding protein [Amycolatopsis sp. CFH S0078]|uniref:peptidoglycan-binding domain-containing protein n=1 Tax=Amycolatopsis sp. CFH S0078 TaxID=1644108 RepID=UPI00196AD8A1|nr:peptidoglycan-binding domain-containing protein [Amycolatopsis sp. CFH S0078]
MAWRLAYALIDLRNEVNTRWPNRDKTSDGTIGDAAHASRSSDHNPWVIDRTGMGVVRAIDIDKDGIDAAWLAEYLRQRGRTGHDGRTGDHRLTNGGYVIYNRRITNEDFSGWHAYTGSNPHTSHVHVSFSRTNYDDRAGWGIAGGGPAPAPAPSGRPTLQQGSTGPAVSELQAFLNRVYPAYSKLVVDGIFGSATADVVREFQRRSGLGVDGIVGAQTWAKLGFR